MVSLPRPSRRLLLAVSGVAGAFLAVGFGAPLLMDTAPYEQLAKESVLRATGKTLVLKSAPRLALLPRFSLTLGAVELANAQPGFSADNVQLDIAPGSLFGSQKRVSKIILQHPVVDVIAGAAESWAGAPVAPLFGDVTGLPDIVLENGSLRVSDGRQQLRYRVDAVDIAFGDGDLLGKFTLGGRIVTLGGGFKNTPNGGGLTTDLKFSSGGDRIAFEGYRAQAQEGLAFGGALSVQMADVPVWFKEPENAIVAAKAGEAKTVPPAPLPLKMSGKLTHLAGKTTLEDMSLESGTTAGKGSAEASWGDVPEMVLNLRATNLDLNPLLAPLAPLYQQALAQAKATITQDLPSPIPQELDLRLELAAESAQLGTERIGAFNLSAQLAEAALTIQQLNFTLPGKTAMSLFGVISQGARGPKFDGSLDTQGESLRDLLAHFEPAAAQLPEEGFGAFSTRANLYIAADQLRLSEAEVKLGTLALSGGLVTYFDARPRVEADMRLKDINLDYFRDAWRRKAQAEEGAHFQLGTASDYGWLKTLPANVDFKVTIDRFTFLETPGSMASFRIGAKAGELGISDIRLSYPDNSVEGSLRLNVAGEVPAVNVVAVVSKLDSRYFQANPDAEVVPLIVKEPGKPKWAEELFDFTWMENLSGEFDATVGRLNWRGETLENLKFKAALRSNQLNVQNLAFAFWGGQVTTAGTLLGGKVPGVSAQFTFYNSSLEQLIHLFSTRENVKGRISLSGVVSASGINWLSWVTGMDLKMSMAARGVMVDGFNLDGALAAVAQARSTGDVFNNVNRVLPDGRTEFSVDGNINVASAVARTPGITLKSGRSTGNFNGELALLPWTLKMTTLFQFPFLSSETVPTLTVDLAGPAEQPETKIDTSSLEAYVAKRIIGQ